MRRTPEFVCNRLPVSGVGFAFVTEMVDRLRILIISIHRIGILNQLAQALRILQHWAGAEMILIKWLVIMISLENRALQCFQQSAVMNICIGIVDEYTRLYVTLSVDMQVTAASGNTSAYILSIILEIHTEDGLGSTEFTNAFVHLCTLFRTQHQFRRSSVAYRHIMEEPYKQGSHIDDLIIECFTGHILKVAAV